MSDSDNRLYQEYRAMAMTALTNAVLDELRELVQIPEDLLLGTILARIDQLESEAS